MPVKHLVLGGGGSSMGFLTYGILQTACREGMLDMGEVESIYCTSAGSVIGPLFCLGLDLEIVADWLINKPWQNVFEIDPESLIDSYEAGGLLGVHTVNELYDNLLLTADMGKDTTLGQLYEKNGIDLHLFCTALTDADCGACDMSHTTHPDLTLKDAVYRSSSIPMIFRPLTSGNTVYLDGGIWSNFPFDPWRAAHPGASLDSVIAICYELSPESPNGGRNPDLRLPTLLLRLLRNLLAGINRQHEEVNGLPYLCRMDQHIVKPEDFFRVLEDRDRRRSLVREQGPELARRLIELFRSHQHSPQSEQTS